MKKLHLLFLLLSMAVAPTLQAQTLHALLFVNEKEAGREVDRQADMENMERFFRDVAAQLGYQCNLRKNSDSEFTASEVDREIESLRVAEGDVVVFYYSGHGYNQGQDKWPTLNLKDKNYWMSSILKKLKNQSDAAKLLLCIADCCNKGANSNALPSLTFNPSSAQNFKDLFINFSGKKTVLMSASAQGQYSWSDLKDGALFGISLRAAIYELTDNSHSSPTWDAVKEKVTIYTERASGDKQTPQVQVIHKASVFED